jgi:hypothetical protein
LRAALMGLRADRLLAASVAGSYATIEALVADSEHASAAAKKPGGKGVGSTNRDLTYTPVTPCRIVDTRLAGGPLAANMPRSFDGYSASGFAAQGGTAGTCDVPSGVAALALILTAVQPAAAGFVNVYPANAAAPNASMLNFAAGQFAIATGAIVLVDSLNANRFNALSPAQVDLVVDVVGYFSAPGFGNSALNAYHDCGRGRKLRGQPGVHRRGPAHGAHGMGSSVGRR